MVVNVTCPTCGHKCRLPQDTPGLEARCPACLNLVPMQSSAPSLLARPTPAEPAAAAPNRTVMAQPEQMIRYTCPRCKKSLESPVSFAGQKLHCPDCNQRLQIPQPSTPAALAVNKTVLATEVSSAAVASSAPVSRPEPTPSPSPQPEVPTVKGQVIEEAPSRADHAAADRENCLECGVDVTQRARVQTCPDCGSLFCSAGCYREHRYHAHVPRRKTPPRDVVCSDCGSTSRPRVTTVISEAGWATFVVLLILFFPLCWIGLLITETRVRCADCGARLD